MCLYLNRYVSEGIFRACHRKEHERPPQGDPRAKAVLPGEPFHTFNREDAADMPQGQAVFCRFQMMPTAYCFAKVCSLSQKNCRFKIWTLALVSLSETRRCASASRSTGTMIFTSLSIATRVRISLEEMAGKPCV